MILVRFRCFFEPRSIGVRNFIDIDKWRLLMLKIDKAGNHYE
jgi:hypothetical protein